MRVPPIPSLIVADGALLSGGALFALLQAEPGERSALISILAGLAGTGIILIAIGIWAVKSHLAFRDKMLVEAEQDRAAVDRKIAEAVTRTQENIERELDLKHRENQQVLGGVRDSLGEVRVILLGAGAAGGGLLEKEKYDRNRRHDLASDVQSLIYRVQALERWAVRACGAPNMPGFDPVPEPSAYRRRETDIE